MLLQQNGVPWSLQFQKSNPIQIRRLILPNLNPRLFTTPVYLQHSPHFLPSTPNPLDYLRKPRRFPNNKKPPFCNNKGPEHHRHLRYGS